MRSTEPSDPELLAAWLEHRRESAFHALVERYAGLVHMTAKRTCGDDSITADATQLTFITLARRAKSLATCSSLGGWLHHTAMLQARNQLRKSERENRKRQLLAMEPHHHSTYDAWKEMQPVLDDALASLSAKDREALLLRFYRSLTVREVAGTLGIATDAAQKRIDRATERLRGKLTRRGVQTGASLGAVMLAGFATDAQAAALSVSALTSKAVAAGTVSFGTIASLIAVWAKPAAIIAAVLALSVTGTWFLRNHGVMADQRISSNQTDVPKRQEYRNPSRTPNFMPHEPASIDWRTIGMRMLEARENNDQTESTRLWNEIIPQVKAMSAFKLSSSLDEISVTKMPPDCRILLEDMLLDPLRHKRPDLVLNRYFHTVVEPKCYPGSPFPMALMDLAASNPFAAAEWLDQQIASQTLDRMTSDNKITARLEMEASVMSGLMPVDFAAALNRLRALRKDQRATVLSRHPSAVPEPHQSTYAAFVREELPERNQIDAIIAPIKYFPFKNGYANGTEYMDRINANPTERIACIEQAAACQLLKIARERNVTRDDFDELRTWVSKETPGLTERMTGEMLGKCTSIGGSAVNRLDFEDAAAIACEYQRLTGDDGALYHFLDNRGNAPPQRVKELALKITDPQRRNSILSESGDQSSQNFDAQQILEHIEKTRQATPEPGR